MLAAACDVGDASYQVLDAPPVEVFPLRAIVLDEEGRSIYGEAAGSVNVLSTTSFNLRFNRFLLPSTAIRQSICLQAKLVPVATLEDCTNPVFLEPTYDPIHREITYRQSSDQPGLDPNTEYQLTVLAPIEEGSLVGIRAFDGAPLATAVSFQFKTALMDPPDATIDALPPGEELFCKTRKQCVGECSTSAPVTACQTDNECLDCSDVCSCSEEDAACASECKVCTDCQTACAKQCADQCPSSVQEALTNCAFASCHRDNRDESGALVLGAAMGLDLGSANGLATTAINKVAHQTQQGEHSDEPDRGPHRFGRAMPLIDVGTPAQPGGAPGNSYLLYKLAIGPSVTGESMPTPDETNRLRAGIVTGMPMPPQQGAALSDADLNAIVAWIAQGAPTPVCP